MLLSTPLLIAVLASVVIPALSALLTREHWDSSITGALTLLLSTATGFLAEWAHAGDAFAWRTAALAALGSWVVAVLSQSRILSGTGLEAKLLAAGSSAAPTGGQPDPTDGLDPETGSLKSYVEQHADEPTTLTNAALTTAA